MLNFLEKKLIGIKKSFSYFLKEIAYVLLIQILLKTSKLVKIIYNSIKSRELDAKFRIGVKLRVLPQTFITISAPENYKISLK